MDILVYRLSTQPVNRRVLRCLPKRLQRQRLFLPDFIKDDLLACSSSNGRLPGAVIFTLQIGMSYTNEAVGISPSVEAWDYIN